MNLQQGMIPSRLVHATSCKLPTFYFIVVLVLALAGEGVLGCGYCSLTQHRKYNEQPSGECTLQPRESIPPAMHETSANASGKYIGPIYSKEFKALVRNYNTLIIFSDRSRLHSQDNRLMTKRCKEKLDILAEGVKAKWGANGVKLLVFTGYHNHSNPEGKAPHGRKNLHHEGRAVDFTTSDRNRTKLPELARMAYAAGFDWVYYTPRGYIHASVMTPKHYAEVQEYCAYYKRCYEPLEKIFPEEIRYRYKPPGCHW